MTRINVGVSPSELCDQHLIAEYRELPRVWRHVGSAPDRAPDEFCLGAGHVLWCARYPGMLRDRYTDLVSEMERRDFCPRWKVPPVRDGARPAAAEIKRARRLVTERLRERMRIMKRETRWTKPARMPGWWRTEV